MQTWRLCCTTVLVFALFAPQKLEAQPALVPPDLEGAPARPSTTPFRGALVASFNLLMLEHAGRVTFQAKTRAELGGPFFRDYERSVKIPGTWGDGDGWFVNYVGHPIHGAAAGRAWLVHHPERTLDIGLSKDYWVSRAKAAQWAAFYSLQFEFGPLSEASIGNVGMNPDTTGWSDHVMTPLGALGIIVAEDALDKYVVRLVERRTGNKWLRGTTRVLLNPSRSLANVVDGRAPWNRPGRSIYR